MRRTTIVVEKVRKTAKTQGNGCFRKILKDLKAIRGDGGVVLVVLRVHAQTTRRKRPPECADVDSAKAIDISLDPSIASGDDYGEY